MRRYDADSSDHSDEFDKIAWCWTFVENVLSFSNVSRDGIIAVAHRLPNPLRNSTDFFTACRSSCNMPSPPTWLSSFVDNVTTCIRSHDELAPLGCHFQHVDGVWEITLFAARTEVIGGPQDGRLRASPFSVDVKEVLATFSSIEKITWQALRIDPSDELGPHLSVEGVIETKPIWLRITSIAPERFEPGRHRLTNRQAFKDIW